MLRYTIAATDVASRTKGVFPSDIELLYRPVACAEHTLHTLVEVEREGCAPGQLGQSRMLGDS